MINRAANAFRMAAQSLANSKTALGAFYRRIRSRLGPPKAITATAHKLARIFYHLWTTGDAYIDMGVDAYEQQYQQRVVKISSAKLSKWALISYLNKLLSS